MDIIDDYITQSDSLIGLILTIDNKRVINFNRLYQILIKDIEQNRVNNSIKHKLFNRAVDKYIKDSYLDWKEKHPRYDHNDHVSYSCNYCDNYKGGLEFITFMDEEKLFLCFKCRTSVNCTARKIISTLGQIEYNKFIQKFICLNDVLQINDVAKYMILILFNVHAI